MAGDTVPRLQIEYLPMLIIPGEELQVKGL